VQNVVIWHERMGLCADEIATEYGLSLADVYAALAPAAARPTAPTLLPGRLGTAADT
jgi:uncharacterized protein (DUF433 family)